MFKNLDASTTHSHLIPPHGGELINLNAGGERTAELKSAIERLPFVGLDGPPHPRS